MHPRGPAMPAFHCKSAQNTGGSAPKAGGQRRKRVARPLKKAVFADRPSPLPTYFFNRHGKFRQPTPYHSIRHGVRLPHPVEHLQQSSRHPLKENPMLPALPPTPHRISVQSSERIGRFFAAKPRESKSRFPWFWAVSRGLRGADSPSRTEFPWF